MAFNVDPGRIGVILLDESADISAGAEVQRTDTVLDVPVGEELLGRVVDPLGRPLDGKGPVRTKQRMPVERPAPEIMDRAPVTVPLMTGLKVVDALIPIGRGQRELILGDRQTGKTAIALDTILNQKGKNVLCIYCAVGKRGSAVAKAVSTLRERDAMDYSLVISSTEEDPPGLQFTAPLRRRLHRRAFHASGAGRARGLRRPDPPRKGLSRDLSAFAQAAGKGGLSR